MTSDPTPRGRAHAYNPKEVITEPPPFDNARYRTYRLCTCVPTMAALTVMINTRKEILWLNLLCIVRRSTVLERKPGLLENVVKKSHHNGEVYYVNQYLLSVSLKMERLRQIFTIYDGYVSLSNILIFRLQWRGLESQINKSGFYHLQW